MWLAAEAAPSVLCPSVRVLLGEAHTAFSESARLCRGTVEGQMPTREHRVLVVDDDREIRGLVAGTLRRDGYTVVEAGDGPEALDVASRIRPDLVVLDMTLPGMDGVEVTRQLKATPILSMIPVVALSALTQDAVRSQALAAGCARYLTKPCPPAALRDVVAQTLAAVGARPPSSGS